VQRLTVLDVGMLEAKAAEERSRAEKVSKDFMLIPRKIWVDSGLDNSSRWEDLSGIEKYWNEIPAEPSKEATERRDGGGSVIGVKRK
jgi:hypothetical protein